MKLPEDFCQRMKDLLADCEVPEEGFFESFDTPSVGGLRFSRSKTYPGEEEKILKELGDEIKPVPWCDGGFYTNFEFPGKTPYYHAGVYYPQEPSAMLPAQVLNARPGEYILDMCAAPGGKACRIGEDLKGQGLLVANEINYNRSKALMRNIERSGITNCVILNETPENIAANLPGFFDKVLIDAPCSGEGMFRRDPQAVKSYIKFGPQTCVPIQKQILESAAKLLKPGGEIVYSTCTFGRAEDEDMILGFMQSHPEFKAVPHTEFEGVTRSKILPGAMRIWPHLTDGDGHFCVHLKKSGELEETPTLEVSKISLKQDVLKLCTDFASDILNEPALERFTKISPYLTCKGSAISLKTFDDSPFSRLNIVKSGLFAAEIKTSGKKVFEPSNSLALALSAEDLRSDSVADFSASELYLQKYLKGETLPVPEGMKDKGYVVVCVAGHPLGFGKVQGGQIKNLYPKAWRLL